MAQKPSEDTIGLFLRQLSWQSDPSNGSVLPPRANATSRTHYSLLFHHRDIFIPVALLIALLGLVGNGTVIWLLGFRVKRNPFSVYILHLAIADIAFLFSLSVVVVLVLLRSDVQRFLSLLIPPFFTFTMAGLSLLMAISTERCLSVTFPIWYKCRRPAHLSTIVCALIWGLSLCQGIPWFLCFADDSFYFLCKIQFLVYYAMSSLTLLVLCVSSLTLLIRVQCCSQQRQVTKLYRVILLTVLAFLLLGLPLGLSFLGERLSHPPEYYGRLQVVFYLMFFLNSAVNPVIYFFVGRQGQRSGRRALRELLQSALTEDTS